jgi:hypothetical protein
MACWTCRQSVWAPACAKLRPPDTRLDTVSADQFLPADNRQWLAG